MFGHFLPTHSALSPSQPCLGFHVLGTPGAGAHAGNSISRWHHPKLGVVDRAKKLRPALPVRETLSHVWVS